MFKKNISRPVMSNSLQPARLLCPWNSPGKNTGVGSHSLLQEIFPTQGSNPVLLHCRQILYHLSHQGSPKQRYHTLAWQLQAGAEQELPPSKGTCTSQPLLHKKPPPKLSGLKQSFISYHSGCQQFGLGPASVSSADLPQTCIHGCNQRLTGVRLSSTWPAGLVGDPEDCKTGCLHLSEQTFQDAEQDISR